MIGPVILWMVAAIVGAVGMLAALRWVARGRGHGLPAVIASEGAQWGSLCRVVRGGAFLDHDRLRRGMGPRAVMVYTDGRLEWRPDRYEVRHGDSSFTWPAGSVRCVSQRRRWDISGVRMREVTLEVPEGEVVIALFHQAGSPPPFLRETPRDPPR